MRETVEKLRELRELKRPIDECEWCGGKNTIWERDPEPDWHDTPEQDDENGTIYVRCNRFCKDCEECYSIMMKFDMNKGTALMY